MVRDSPIWRIIGAVPRASRLGPAAVLAFGLIAGDLPDRAAGAQTRKPPVSSRPAHRPVRGLPAAGGSADGGTRASPPPESPLPLDDRAIDAGVVEAKTLDGGTQVFKFSALDIEGRLKSPQLVYFLRRVRAEFAAGELGHRSFLREMAETRKEPSF